MKETDRTAQKLRYALVHLHEVEAHRNVAHGDDFERSHHEAFLAQLFGAYEAFLQELNILLCCGLPAEHLTLGKLRQATRSNGTAHPVVAELFALSQNENSWLGRAKGLRDYITHISGIPIAMYAGGVDDGKIALIDPRSKIELPADLVLTFRDWLSQMEQLTARLRTQATTNGQASGSVAP